MNVMQTYSMPVSSKGQITIPVDIRKLLKIDKIKRVVLEVLENQKVILKSREMSLDDVYGAVKPIEKDFSKVREIARKERILRRKNK